MLQHMVPHCVHLGCTKDSAGDWKQKKGYEVGRGKQWFWEGYVAFIG